MLKAVEINNLSVQYPDVKALDDVSFVVNEGDFLGIIGPNGAGKSTLFDCMLGLNTKYKGTIKFFGEDIKKSKNFLKEIGYVPQKPIFEKNFRQLLVMLLEWDYEMNLMKTKSMKFYNNFGYMNFKIEE